MFSYPLQVHPCRASLDAVLKWRPTRSSNPARTGSNPSPSRVAPLLPPSPTAQRQRFDHIPEFRFALLTTIIIILSYITAMTVNSLEKVLAYVGSTGSTSISFILPGLFYYKISAPDSFYHQRLLKDEDDEDCDEGAEEEGLLGGAGVSLRVSSWRRKFLRQAALGLAVYGLVVMVVCLATNTFVVVAH